MWCLSSYSQVKKDKSLIIGKRTTVVDVKRHVRFGVTGSRNVFVRYNPLSLIAGVAMYGYQKILSPQLSATCGFNPSCSEHGKMSIKTYGFFKGTFCTADRLMKCNKLGMSDYKVEDHDHDDLKIHEGAEFYK